MRTIITHFYNEEYLLPWWLEHHKKIFDYGILIDYSSTDRSVEIIRSICPHWQIFPSAYGAFDAQDCDREVEYYERQVPGWRIALTVTEFLVGDIGSLTHSRPERTQYLLPPLIFADYDPFRKFDRNKPLWEQCTTAISYKNTDDGYTYRGTGAQIFCRSLHNYNDMQYQTGRHFMGYNTGAASVFKFSNCLVGEEMFRRRLQIGAKVSDRDRSSGCADQHLNAAAGGLNLLTLPKYYMDNILSLGPVDCSDIIKQLAG